MFPYKNTFEINYPKLSITPTFPSGVVDVMFAKSPMASLNGGLFKLLAKGNETAFITLDFGKEIVGDITFSAVGNGKLHILYGESVEELDCNKEELTRSWYRYPEDFYEVSNVHHFHSAGRRGFRYIRIVATEGNIQISNLLCQQENYPVESRGSFFCSDEKLNKIWTVCERTTRLCMQSWFEDGIKRDGLLWIGDARIQMLCNYALFGDTKLAQECIKMMANSQRNDGMTPACAVRGGAVEHPGRIEYMFGLPKDQLQYMTDDQGSLCLLNYCVDFIGLVHDYFIFSGDLDTVTQIYPFLVRQANFLFDTINKNDFSQFLLFPYLTTRIVDNIDDITAYLSCLLFGLKDFVKLSKIVKDEVQEKIANEKIAELKKRLSEEFTDEKGFIQNKENSFYSSTAHSFAHMADFISAQTLCNLYENENNKIANAVIGMCEYWQMRGMMSAGLTERTIDYIKEIYGIMLDSGATTCFEAMDPKEPELRLTNYRQSRCHGWSAGPADLFVRYILGVQFMEPGGKTVKIKPNLANLSWAEGTVPTAYGDIHIRIDKYGTHFDVPQGIKII